MANVALDNFRSKYPAYADRSDAELATALAKKYPEAYGSLLESVPRGSALDQSLAASEQDIAQRPAMQDALMREIKYNPIANKDLSFLQKARQIALKPASLALKGLGTIGQNIEAGVANPLLDLQRGDTSDLGSEVWKGITGQKRGEYGDVFRGAGVDDTTSAALGLILSGGTPGIGQMAKAVRPGAKLAQQGIAKGTRKLGEGVARGGLALGARASDHAINQYIKTSGDIVKRGQSALSIEQNVTGSLAKANKAADYIQKRATKFYGNMVNKHAKDMVPYMDQVGTSFADGALKVLVDSKQVIAGAKGGIKYATKEARDLMSTLKELNKSVSMKGDNRGMISVEKMQFYKNKIKSLASDDSLGGVYAAANKLQDDLSGAINKAHPDIQIANKLYKETQQILKGNEIKNIPGVEGLLDATKAGSIKASGYGKLAPGAREAMSDLENFNLPARKKFLGSLERSTAATEFASYRPKSQLSLIGAGVTLARPQMWPALMASLGVSSPRTAGFISKLLMKHPGTSPASKAIMTLTEQGIIDPGIIRLLRESAMYPSEQEQQ